MKKKSEKQKDHFLRLSDEIIITIFTKLSKTHFKFLCQNVALVSKRFAFLLHHIPAISISIPWSKLHLPPQSFNPLVILEKFVEIHSLHIEFVAEHDTSPNSEPIFFKWKANSNTKSQTFVFLSSTSILDKKEYKGQEEDDNELQIRTTYVQLSSPYRVLVFGCFSDSCLWLLLMKLLIHCHPFLQSVKITDSNKHGMLCIRDQNLCKSRNSSINKANGNVRRDDINHLQNITKVGYLPVLHLPLSGLMMKGVIISMFRVAEEASDDDSGDYDDILNWDFEDGEELFGEAVTTIFRNHHNILFRYQSTM